VSSTEGVEVFAALGDANRLRLLELLVARGSASATTLAGSLDVSRQAVVKHLAVLEQAGLVDSRREGRQVLHGVRPEQLQRSADRLTGLAAAWDRRLAAVKSVAEGP
jgi:DNA-binding transcriptional ArsR family regulator